MDIEDLHRLGREKHLSVLLSRALHRCMFSHTEFAWFTIVAFVMVCLYIFCTFVCLSVAEIVFVPYNYLLIRTRAGR